MVLEITRVTKVVNHSNSSIEIRQFERGDVFTLPKGGVATCDIPIPWHSFTHPADKFMRVFFYASQRYYLLWQRDQHILTGDITNGHQTWPNGGVNGPRDLYIYGNSAQTYGIRLYDAGKSPPLMSLNPVPKSGGVSGFSTATTEADAPETPQAGLLAEAPDYIREPAPGPAPQEADEGV